MTQRLQAQTRPWSVLVLAMILLAYAVWLLTGTGGPDSAAPNTTGETPAMLAVAPGGTVELAALPAEHQMMYRAAAADPEAFQAVACYCGCEEFLDHRHLLDCFERPDGGWERHATGCAVCLVEARDVVEMRADGTPIAEIIQQIDDRY
ncbi:MAG: PCYCGC motif-containing (lipo)protein, partial [Nitriliruptoraceae bacterium]